MMPLGTFRCGSSTSSCTGLVSEGFLSSREGDPQSAVKLSFSPVPCPGEINKPSLVLVILTLNPSLTLTEFLMSPLDARPHTSAHIGEVSEAGSLRSSSPMHRHRCSPQRQHNVSFHSSSFVLGSKSELAGTSLQRGKALPGSYCQSQPTPDGKTHLN